MRFRDQMLRGIVWVVLATLVTVATALFVESRGISRVPMSEAKSTLVGVLFALLAILIVVLSVVNTFCWIRFDSLYRRYTLEKMPPLIFDFGGRWWRARSEPHPEPEVERTRRDLNRSMWGFLAVLIVMGALELVLFAMR